MGNLSVDLVKSVQHESLKRQLNSIKEAAGKMCDIVECGFESDNSKFMDEELWDYIEMCHLIGRLPNSHIVDYYNLLPDQK